MNNVCAGIKKKPKKKQYEETCDREIVVPELVKRTPPKPQQPTEPKPKSA